MKSPLQMNVSYHHVEAEVRDEDVISFAGILDALYSQRFTGAITLHFKDGKPSVVDMPAPKIKLR